MAADDYRRKFAEFLATQPMTEELTYEQVVRAQSRAGAGHQLAEHDPAAGELHQGVHERHRRPPPGMGLPARRHRRHRLRTARDRRRRDLRGHGLSPRMRPGSGGRQRRRARAVEGTMTSDRRHRDRLVRMRLRRPGVQAGEHPGLRRPLGDRLARHADFGAMGCDHLPEDVRSGGGVRHRRRTPELAGRRRVPRGHRPPRVRDQRPRPLLSCRPTSPTAVLGALGLVDCVPHFLSFQRCCSSLTALRHGRALFSDPDVTHVLVVALDFTPDDRDRVRSYAVFGDAAASCLLTRRDPGLVRLVSSAIHVDHEGLRGHDSFVSRKRAARPCAVIRARRERPTARAGHEGVRGQPARAVDAVQCDRRGSALETLHFADTLPPTDTAETATG